MSTQRASQTKIVATVGPASTDEAVLGDLIAAGVDVFRINAAHGDRPEHQHRVDTIRRVSRVESQPVAILVDLAGPKIRLGELPDGQIECRLDESLRLVRGETSGRPGELTTTYPSLIDELTEADHVMLADGTVALRVERVEADFALCRVVQPGEIRSRQGVNLPGVKLSIPSLGDSDRDNALWAARAGVDFLGLSFVRASGDVRELKSLVAPHNPDIRVIAKIEKPEALDDLEEIITASDGLMVARGDLGVEIDIARMAVVQKEIIAACSRQRKPVIIATQMLDSMQHSLLPTRAEATDVANAILDGADACMLSGETAIGRHPVEAVKMMHRIALATEPIYRERPPLAGPDLKAKDVNQITEATAYAAGRIAEQLDAQMVVVASATGQAALSLSKNRHFVPTVGVSQSEATLRRMCLYWGVIPLSDAPTDESGRLLDHASRWGQEAGYLAPGDRIVLLTGGHVTDRGHNTIVVHEVESGKLKAESGKPRSVPKTLL